ncbi:MAG: endonuclease/exonuclease/phosphatase family protein [Clostridia bacterium]|nr:endonuclease/exonuclease/phosphatase family protein [Clostridia bacterium]
MLKIVSFNLRCVWDGDGVNCFPNRAAGILLKIWAEKPDVIGFQEGTEENVAFLRENLKGYDIIYNQRDADFGGEGLAVAVRTETVTLLGVDFFWLSETPDVPGSRYAIQSDCPRICQCLLLKKNDTKQLFRVYNNHLDHVSDSARILGIKQVMERVAADSTKFGTVPGFILGDFNAEPGSETIEYCDNYKPYPIKDLTAGMEGTFHDFGRLEEPVKIDFIYTDVKTAEKPYTVTRWMDERCGVYLSDHYPVCLEIEA